MGQIEINHTGSGGTVVLSSDGTDLLLGGSAVGGGASAYTINTKTSAYTLVDGDLGKIISFTSGTVAATLPAGSGLATGWYASVWNDGSGVISITPAGSDYIGSSSSNGHNSGDLYALQRGMGVQLVWNGTRWNLKNDKPYDYFKHSTSIGENSLAGNNYSVAIGSNAVSGGVGSIAIGSGLLGNPTAYGSYGVAIGDSSYNHSTGNRAVSLGKSYSASADSFAAVITNNTSSYGATGANSVAIGRLSKATDADSFAIGYNNVASGNSAFALGYANTASGQGAIALGRHHTVSGLYATCIGGSTSTATQTYAMTFGPYAKAAVQNAFIFGSKGWFSAGSAQGGMYILYADTTNATAEALTTTNSTAGSTNQIVAASDTCIMFSGTVVAMQNGAADQGGWEIKGLLKNDGGTTTLVNSNVQTFDDGNSWAVALSADNTNNALKVQVTGEASHNIRWVANIQTSEVTYA
jgi:trimeric autotransporter adhesin